MFKDKVAVITGGAQGIGRYGHVDFLVNNALPLSKERSDQENAKIK